MWTWKITLSIKYDHIGFSSLHVPWESNRMDPDIWN